MPNISPCFHAVSKGQCLKIGKALGVQNEKLPCVYPFCEKNGMHYFPDPPLKDKQAERARLNKAAEVHSHTETALECPPDVLKAKDVETTTRPKITRVRRK